MINKELTWEQVIKKMDEFEQQFKTNPADSSLPEFFKTFGEIISDNVYTTEELKEIRNRMLNLRELFAKAREDLTERSNEALDRHKQVSQYLKTSHIKKNQ